MTWVFFGKSRWLKKADFSGNGKNCLVVRIKNAHFPVRWTGSENFWGRF
jgi:hypothetical protein